MIFLPSQPLALIPLEKKTGIVVDVGYSETNVISVVSGSILNHTLQSELMGKRDILKKMESCLRSYPSQFKYVAAFHAKYASYIKYNWVNMSIFQYGRFVFI